MERLLHLDRTLDELHGPPWPPAPADTTQLVARVHALRSRPLSTLTPADLRTLVAQQVSLPYTLPLAVTLLLEDPMLDAYFYEGDLLLAVLALPASAWALFPDLAAQLTAAVEGLPPAATAELARLAGPGGLGRVGE
ncbi:contact-dependent growth inhibition system immunity protein [Streptomyces sp. MB09-01]|uniref:contact-dependent growth inhibition system immunity protein n=1 Tax=Streptomyces sp. MB09-01 TaxID=3028666 RepID=UPI0029BA6BA3|nr:contact-dependent growth inhibition system immunity protein [Streptomyces sp. MB09-01]MDX3537129.1 contact-dependent growth inhibition system immunity protein [Streptomyces sp. MB09-01]